MYMYTIYILHVYSILYSVKFSLVWVAVMGNSFPVQCEVWVALLGNSFPVQCGVLFRLLLWVIPSLYSVEFGLGCSYA